MENYLPSVIIGLAILALVIRRQLRTTPLTAWRMYVIPLLFAAYGVVLVLTKDHGRFLDPAHEALGAGLLAAELVAAVLLGVLRAITVSVWRDGDGTVWRRGNRWTVAAWIVSVLVRLGLAGIAALLGVHSSIGMVMEFVAVTLLAQNLFIGWRGRDLPMTATVQA